LPNYFGIIQYEAELITSFVVARWQHRTDGLAAICNCTF